MEIFLLKDAVVALQPSVTPHCCLQQKVEMLEYHGTDQVGKSRTEKLRQLIENKRQGEDWNIEFTLKFHGEEMHSKVDISVKGNLLEELHRLMYYGNNEERLKLSIFTQVVLNGTAPAEHGNVCILKINVNDLQPLSSLNTESNLIKHNLYQQNGIRLTDGQWKTEMYDWNFSLKLDADDFIPLADILPNVAESNRRILNNRKFCDFKIVAGDGTVIDCHKIFLLESPVLAAMIINDDDESKPAFQEAIENEVTLDDMTADGINALLEFLYCGMVAKPIKYASIALELFEAGHKYHIVALEEVMKKILLEKSCKWFDVDTTLKLYQFVRNYEGSQKNELTKKVTSILLSATDLKSSDVFRQVFGNDVAMEIFQIILSIKKVPLISGGNGAS